MLKVCSKQCDQCLFSENRIVSAARMKEIVDHCRAHNVSFECHKGTVVDESIICAGFFANFSSHEIRIAKMYNQIEMVDPDTVIKEAVHKKRGR